LSVAAVAIAATCAVTAPLLVGSVVKLQSIERASKDDKHATAMAISAADRQRDMPALKLGMETSKFHGREDGKQLIAALEGLVMKERDDFPQGDKTLRKEDHQAFGREFIFDVKGGKHNIVEVVPMAKTIVPPACHFA
jgi:hypothetical protein